MKAILFSASGNMLDNSLEILSKNKIEISSIVTTREKEVYLPHDADVLISMCYPYRISEDILQKYKYCINFSPRSIT